MLRNWIVARHHLTGVVAKGNPRLGLWAGCSYSRRATLWRLARFRSSALDISEAVMFGPRRSALRGQAVLGT